MVPWIAVTTARRIFLWGCFLPTLGVISWTATRGLPGRSARVSHNLSQDLRLLVDAQGDSTPRPGLSHFTRLELSHGVTRQKLVSFDELSVTHQREGYLIHGPRSVVELHAVHQLAAWLQSLVMDSLSRNTGVFRVAVDSVELRHGGEVWSLGAVDGSVVVTPDRSEVRIGFRRSNAPHAQPSLEITGEVLYASTSRVCRWEVDVRDREPARLLAPLDDRLNLGADARWRGHLQWQAEFGAPWSATLQGRLDEVRLDHLTHSALTGNATLDIESSTFSPQGLQACAVSVRAPQGKVVATWVDAWHDAPRSGRGGAPTRSLPRSVSPLATPPQAREYSNLAVRLLYEPSTGGWLAGPLTDPDHPDLLLPILRHGDSEQVWLNEMEMRELPPLLAAP